MVTYNLQKWENTISLPGRSGYSLNKGKMYYTFDVQGGLAGIKKAAYGKVPDGSYLVFSKNGKQLYTVNITATTFKNAQKKRAVMPKSEYDQLYYYMNGDTADHWVFKMKESPLRYTSPRRYDTLNEVRKAALAKSRAVYKENVTLKSYGMKGKSFAMYVFKGTKFLGVVHYDWMGHFDGLWASAEHIKDPQPLRKDGSLR